jgi:glycogen synthase
MPTTQTRLTYSDFLFHARTESWTPLRSVYHQLFSHEEIDRLFQAKRGFDIRKRCIVFLSFENRYASLGGLGAIGKLFPRHLAHSGERVLFVTPLHVNHPAICAAIESGAIRPQGAFICRGARFSRRVTWYHEPEAEVPTYYLAMDGFFTAQDNPYHYGDSTMLLHDSLAFSVAVPFLVARLGLRSNLLFHANDWETAPVALTSKYALLRATLKSAGTILTLHNSFDHDVPAALGELYWGPMFKDGGSVLSNVIPFLDGPLATVSAPFGHELRHDPVQRDYFAPHLQTAFSRNPPVGIEHGLFGVPQRILTKRACELANSGDYSLVLAGKGQSQERLYRELGSSIDRRAIGRITSATSGLKAPVFFMSGRLDMGQKGFDVVFHAFQRLKRGCAKLLFCPSTGSDTSRDLDFFARICRECRGDIAIWPFRIPALTYRRLLRGASYLVMPSLYEPFGAATEGFLFGTPVIARATGGLWTQVASVTPCQVPRFYRQLLTGEPLCGLKANGVLYRERYRGKDQPLQWRRILEQPPDQRPAVPLYRSMVEAAHAAMTSAIAIYHDPLEYGRMICNGLDSLNNFSWERAVEKYRAIYDIVSYHRGI